MPREISDDRYRGFVEQGLAAVRALEVGDAMTHLEGFLLDGGRACFTDATLRPAGARIGPMLGFAYDVDPYRVWARVAVDGCFDGPWERRYAVGTVFLRGVGRGQVDRVEGLEAIEEQDHDVHAPHPSRATIRRARASRPCAASARRPRRRPSPAPGHEASRPVRSASYQF